ncbi:hypothetical protein OAF54_03675 [bacterium]|nr:hypothetical protein [bacterium]
MSFRIQNSKKSKIKNIINETLPTSDALTEGSVNLYASVSNKKEHSTAVLSGGVLSLGTPNTTFSISDGQGVVVNGVTGSITSVEWSGLTNIAVTNIATQNITYISIDENKVVIQRSTKPTNQNRRDEIYLGVVVHVNRTNVNTFDNQQNTGLQIGNQLHDVINALGFLNLNGNITSGNADLTIDKSEGTMLATGANYENDVKNPHVKTIAAQSPVTFQYRFTDGISSGDLTNIDPDNLDDLAGGTTALSNSNKWSVQRVYTFVAGNVIIQRGQVEYNTQADAVASISSEAFTVEPSVAANGLLIGYVVVKKEETNLSTGAEFVGVTKFGGQTTNIGVSNAAVISALDGINIAYTPTNVTTTRAYDADTVTTAVLADVVGTLIADLQSKNILI